MGHHVKLVIKILMSLTRSSVLSVTNFQTHSKEKTRLKIHFRLYNSNRKSSRLLSGRFPCDSEWRHQRKLLEERILWVHESVAQDGANPLACINFSNCNFFTSRGESIRKDRKSQPLQGYVGIKSYRDNQTSMNQNHFAVGSRIKCKVRPDVKEFYHNQQGKITEIVEPGLVYRVVFDNGLEGAFYADKSQLKLLN